MPTNHFMIINAYLGYVRMNSAGFDVPIPAWRHLAGYDVTLSMVDNTGNSVDWRRIAVGIEVFRHVECNEVKLTDILEVGNNTGHNFEATASHTISVISAAGGNTRSSPICHQIVMTIAVSSNVLLHAVDLSLVIAVSGCATICDYSRSLIPSFSYRKVLG